MEWSTHALSGVVAGYTVTGGDWKGAAVGGIAGVIPDLDEHKSKFGKILFPISYPINKIFGHRTLTHSLLFTVLMGAVFYFLIGKWFSVALMSGIIAHILGDLVTGKVKLFYPLNSSIGIEIPHYSFTIIDRIVRIGLFVWIISIVWTDYIAVKLF